uniref:Zinc finger SWIM-type containing 9 n=1 Tax=Gorilla gorilla gorilla TaxID=9595 RepID=A0A2I2ZYP3_GORGO
MERPEPPPGTAAGQEEQELRERAFFSWAEFSRFFDAWCQQRLALFFVKSSMHLARCRWASAPPLYTLIDVLKYSYVRLVCKDVRAPSRPAVGPPQPGCPAFIIVKLSPLRDRLVVTECQLTHSHPACPLEFAYYFRPGHLLANACLPVRTTNKISKQFVAPADVRRLLSYCKGRDHGVLDALHVLEGLFRTDPEAKVKLVFVEDQAVVETVFFLTSRTRALLRRFPRMLLVDRLPGLWSRLCRLAGASSPAAYDEALAELHAHGPAAFVDYFERNWEPRRDMWVRFRAFEAARDLDACALVRGHRRRLLRRLSPSRGVAQCLRDLVAMQWADAAGEAVPEGPDGGGPWLEDEPGRGAQGENERVRGLETGDWGGAPKEGSIWRGAQMEKEWARALETRDWGGAQFEGEKGRALQIRDRRGGQLENQKPRGLEGGVLRGSKLEKGHLRGPEIRDWRGPQLEGEKDWGLEGYVWRGAQLEDQALRGLEGYTWRVAQLEDRRSTTDLRGTQFDYERVRSLEGSPWRGAQPHDERAGGLRTAEWKGPQSEVEKGRGLEVRNLRGIPLEKSLELAPENGDQRGLQWEDERRRGPEIAEERGAKVGVKRRRGLEDIVLVQLGDTRVTGMENGDGGGARSVGPKSRAGRGMEWGDAGGRCLGLGNGVVSGTPVGTVLEGSPEWAAARSEHPAAGDGLQEGGEDGPREPKRLCRPPGEEEVDWEPLAKFRAACGPELADLVAEELAFARQHGTRGFHWTGAGFALKDGTSDFFLDGALTRCSCSIHAARRLPCRHLFAARLLTGAALFHMDLLRDCWGRAPEP